MPPATAGCAVDLALARLGSMVSVRASEDGGGLVVRRIIIGAFSNLPLKALALVLALAAYAFYNRPSAPERAPAQAGGRDVIRCIPVDDVAPAAPAR
jgi:hypothetical protein